MASETEEHEAALILMREVVNEQASGSSVTPAFDLLYIMYSPRILRSVLVRYYNTTEAMLDASNVVWSKVFNGAETWRESSKVTVHAWLIAVAQNYARDDLVSRKRVLEEQRKHNMVTNYEQDNSN